MLDNETQIDITANLVAVGAGNTLNLTAGAPFAIIPRGILISTAVEGIHRVMATPLRGKNVVSLYLKSNIVHKIAIQSIAFDNTTTSPIVLVGSNL